jgi:hypothetical protein
MKQLIIAILFAPIFAFAQNIKTKTVYAQYSLPAQFDVSKIEEVIYYNQQGLEEKTIVYGLVDSKYFQTDTMLMAGVLGDSMVIVQRIKFEYNDKIVSATTLKYDEQKRLIERKEMNYELHYGRLDSTINLISYQYLPQNKMIRTDENSAEKTQLEFTIDANGVKIASQYAFTLDAKNRIIEKHFATDQNKTGELETYTYWPNGKLKETKVLKGGQLKRNIMYKYDAKNSLISKTTKNGKGKKATSESIVYTYQNGVCISETTSNTGEPKVVQQYSYTYY